MAFRAFLISLALLLPASASAIDVAVYGWPSDAAWNIDVGNKIEGTGFFDTVDVFTSTTPSLSDLIPYDAVFIYSDGGFSGGGGVGDVLADYIDGGGGVVMTTFLFVNGGSLGFTGRIITDGYMPFTLDSQAQNTPLTLVPIESSHEILAGVSSFSGGTASYHNSSITVTPGATTVANWSNGQPLVAEWAPFGSGVVVGVNVYAPSSDARSDFWATSTDGDILFGNALVWAAGGGCEVLDADLDGQDSIACGGLDCDDDDPTIYDGATEVCDDIDQDCDGDLIESFVDTDFDGAADCIDDDDDNDGLTDGQEVTVGTDPLSSDSDNDSVPDADEIAGSLANPPDTDEDGIIDALDPDDDGDGIPTQTEVFDAETYGEDPDGDGIPSWLDLDSDGDGILDAVEGNDDDQDGIPDYLDPTSPDAWLEGGCSGCAPSSGLGGSALWVWGLALGFIGRRRDPPAS